MQFVSGSDIAELLLRGHNILEPSASTSVLAGRPGGEGGEVTSPEGADDGSSPSPDEGIVVSDRAQLGTTSSSHTLAKFREFLLFGHKKVRFLNAISVCLCATRDSCMVQRHVDDTSLPILLSDLLSSDNAVSSVAIFPATKPSLGIEDRF